MARLVNRWRLRSLLFGCALCMPAWGQQQTRVDAEALFNVGIERMRQGDFERGCPALEQSLALDAGVGTMLYLAECYELSGRTATAWATFKEAAAVAGARGQQERARQGSDRAARLEPHLSRVTVTTAPENAKIPGFQVRRADTVLPPAALGTPVPVDPGDYTVEASAPGHESVRLSLHVGPDADEVELAIPALSPLPPQSQRQQQPVSASGSLPAQDQPPAASRTGATQRLWGWGALGIGAVGVGVGTAFGLRAIARNNDAQEYCTGTVCDDRRGETLTDDAQQAATWSNVGFAVGAVGAAAGVVLLVTAPRSRSTSLRLTPSWDPLGRAVGVTAGGTF